MINTNPNLPGPQTPVQQSDNPDLYMGMATGQAGGATASSPTDWSPSLGGSLPPAMLTPDALMAYCENRVGSLDSQIQTIFAQQQQSSDLIKTIDTVANDVSVAGQNGVDGKTPGQLAALEQEIVNAINQAGGLNTPTGAELNGALKSLDPTCTAVQSDPSTPASVVLQSSGASADAGQVAAAVKGLQNAAQDVNSGAELSMIQLQSLMSERQTAIQLTTNLVQSLGQQMNAIASNVGK
jgi:hypothetical protein